MANQVYIYTGGYSKTHLLDIHNYLQQNNIFFVPSRATNGSLMFDVGPLSEDDQKYISLMSMLHALGYWYSKRNA